MSDELATVPLPKVLQPGTPEYDAALLALQGGNNQLAKNDPALLAEMTKRGDYLPRLKLQGSNSDLVKDEKIKRGNYAFIEAKDTFVDLGPSVDIMPFVWTPMALDMNEKPPITVWDETSEFFADIKRRADAGGNSRCTWGPQFLIWIPAISRFAGLHCGSKTDRPRGKQLNDLAYKGVTLTWEKIDNGTFKWEGIVVNPCSTPFAIPSPDQLAAQIAKFNDVASTKVEAPEKADVKTRAR